MIPFFPLPDFSISCHIQQLFFCLWTTLLKKCSLTGVFTLCTFITFAQQGILTGQVTNEVNVPQSNITVTLLNAVDSISIKTTLTNDKGNFEFTTLGEGVYLIQTSAIGFKKFVTKPILIHSLNLKPLLEIIRLETMLVDLKEITITAKKQAIERQIDRTIINIDGVLSNAGTNAWEMLEQSPGIQIANDNLSLKGKQNVTVFIDNKPLYLQGDDLANYLKSLPASLLDKVEIIPNPPARYDAAGNGGIINIKLKKGTIKGFNGTILSENIRGNCSRISQSINFNLRSSKINIYGNASNYNGTGLSIIKSRRSYPIRENNLLRLANQKTTIKNPNHRILGKLGLDFYASPKTIWGISFSYLYRDLLEKTTLINRQAYVASQTDSIIKANNQAKSTTNNTSFTMSFRHLYDSTGRELTADVDYIKYGQDYVFSNNSIAYEENKTDLYTEILKGDLPYSIAVYSIKTDYTHPFKKGIKLEAGYKSSFTKINTRADYSTIINEIDLSEKELSNQFLYHENINSFYLNYTMPYKKFSFQVGARIENTVSKGRQRLNSNTSFERRYTNLFPTSFISYQLSKQSNQQLHISYGKRIDRPGYADLNPFAAPLDRYTYREGNPFLKSQLSDNIEFSYLFKNIFTLGVFYTNSQNDVDETIAVKENTFYRRPANIGQKQIIGFSLDGTLNLTEWWTINPVVVYTNTHSQTLLYNDKLDIQSNNWSISTIHQLNFVKQWSAEVITDYSSPQVYAQFVQAATWYVHMGIGKKLWNDKGTIKLNVRDIFYSRVDRQDFSNLKGVTGYTNRVWDTRSITLTLSYRFSKGIKTTHSNHKTGTAEENKRLGEQ